MMKKLFIGLAAAGLMVGCAHNDSEYQGATSSDAGMTSGQGAAAEQMQHGTQPANQGGIGSQSGSTTGNSSSSSNIPSSSNGSLQNTNSANTPSSALGVTPGAAETK